MGKVITVLILIVIIVVIEIKRELSCFHTVEYDLHMHGLTENKKILFLSDMHNHVYGKNNHVLLDAIRMEKPNLILIGGDMLVGKEGVSYQKALDFVKMLPDISQVYYANGNHEQRMKENPEDYSLSYDNYKKELLDAGVHFLENESVVLNWDNKKVKVTGLEIPSGNYLRMRKAELKNEELTERIGERDDSYYEILLAHNPSYMKEYLERGADLILSGHLHGGIVRIPGVVGAISPSFELFPKYSGDHYREGNTDIVVSKGLGTHTIKIRLFNPAELIVIEFTGD